MWSGLYQAIFGPNIKDDQEYIRFTYRNHIKPIFDTTKYTSDSGWGCMLRVLQMAIANLIYLKEKGDPKQIVGLFYDNCALPFSIQSLTKSSKTLFPHKKQCQWYNPSQAGFLIQHALQTFNTSYRVAVCNDGGSIFLNELPRDRERLVVLVMARIGLDKPEPHYLDALINIMNNRFFFAVLGGTPRYAHLFLKHQQGYFGYLDPHETKRAAQSEEQMGKRYKQCMGKLQWVKKEKVSSSMCLMFEMDTDEINQFWLEMKCLKLRCGDDFFLYLAQEKQTYEESGIIEIEDDPELE